MKKEIDCAVETFHRIAFGTKKNGTKYISESKLSCFITVLTKLLFARCEKNWYPENPERGSGYRCIRVNTQCIDPTIVESMRKANIRPDQMVGTSELTVWVDPGVVSVRIGEDGSIGMEVVDEEVHRMSKTSARLEKSGSVETDSSSRSSSPELDRSQSSSPSFSSPHPPSRSSPPMEYNPYNPPARVNYPMRFQQGRSPPVPSPSPSTMSSPPPKSVSSHQAYPPSPMAPPRGTHIPPSFSGSPVSFSAADSYSRPHGMTGYTRPRAIFPSSSHCSDQSMDRLPNKAFVPYSLPLSSARNMTTSNFYDIPAMA